MKIISISALGLLCCLCITTAAVADDAITEIRLASERWENITNEDGSGLYWDIFRAVYEPLGISVTFEIVPYARSVKMVENKEADAAVGAYADEFEALFPEWHFDHDTVVAVFKQGTVEQWEGEASLKGRLGWMRNYGYDQYLKAPHEYVEIDTRKSALRMLQIGRIDFFLDARADILAELAKGDVNREELQLETLFKLKIYLAFAETERGRKLRDIFDERMAELVPSGELKPLFEKWGFLYAFNE